MTCTSQGNERRAEEKIWRSYLPHPVEMALNGIQLQKTYSSSRYKMLPILSHLPPTSKNPEWKQAKGKRDQKLQKGIYSGVVFQNLSASLNLQHAI